MVSDNRKIGVKITRVEPEFEKNIPPSLNLKNNFTLYQFKVCMLGIPMVSGINDCPFARLQ